MLDFAHALSISSPSPPCHLSSLSSFSSLSSSPPTTVCYCHHPHCHNQSKLLLPHCCFDQCCNCYQPKQRTPNQSGHCRTSKRKLQPQCPQKKCRITDQKSCELTSRIRCYEVVSDKMRISLFPPASPLLVSYTRQNNDASLAMRRALCLTVDRHDPCAPRTARSCLEMPWSGSFEVSNFVKVFCRV